SEGGGNELLVTGTGSCSSGCVKQICTGHKSYKAQLSPPLLLRFTARASQERLSAAAGDRGGGVLEHVSVCEVSVSIASLAVSRPGTAGIQPATEQPAGKLALIAMRLTPPSLHVISVGRSVRRLLLTLNKQRQVHQRRAADMEPQPNITQRARAEEGAWARDLPRLQALLLDQISAASRVCEVSVSIASLAVSRPGTAGIQPATEQPAAAAAGWQAGH
ncbi:unnamed protein product, partial [Pleuronectes platessa]